MASMYDELDEKLLNQLLVKITIIEKMVFNKIRVIKISLKK